MEVKTESNKEHRHHHHHHHRHRSRDEKKEEKAKTSKWTSQSKDMFSEIKTIKVNKKGEVIDVTKKPLVGEKLINKAKEAVNFNPSGLLAQQTNMKNGILLKYTTPQDKAIPTKTWCLFEFEKNASDPIKTYNLINRDNFLIGKDNRLAHILLAYDDCSRQHAVIQFRKKIIKHEDENYETSITTEIVPYIIDLESTNGTSINNDLIETSKYYELKDKDVLNFGGSPSDFVLLLTN